MYALIRALEKWQDYLLPKEFVIHTNHEALRYITGQNKLNKRHAKWVEFLESFPYVIRYKKGKENVVADALSRRYAFLSYLDSHLIGFAYIRESYPDDPDFRDKFYACEKGGLMGHFGVTKTLHTLKEHLFWTLWSKIGTKLMFSTTCYPQTDGQTEVVNRSLSTLLRSIIKKNIKTWDDCLPHIEFSYNHVIHSATKMSPFEVVYGFNPITPLDLLPLPQEQVISKEGKARVDYVKRLHQKLLPRVDGPFQVLEKVNDNAYKLDLPGDYKVSATFNVSDLSPYDDSAYLRTNPFQEGGNDVSTTMPKKVADPEVLPLGPITRSRARKFREVLSLTCTKLSDSFDDVNALDNKLFNVLHTDVSVEVQELVSAQRSYNPSASSFQLTSAPFSSTSTPLAQLKLNNPEVAETYPAFGRVSWKLSYT
ncbi:hypothetical protein GQ457_07G006290 [Hibiscus cannabinus]